MGANWEEDYIRGLAERRAPSNGDKRKRHFGMVYHWLVDRGYLARMTGSQVKVYLALLRHADFSTRECFPTRKVIAQEAHVHASSISRITRDLVSMGLIKKAQSLNGPCHYELLTEPIMGIMNKIQRPLGLES